MFSRKPTSSEINVAARTESTPISNGTSKERCGLFPLTIEESQSETYEVDIVAVHGLMGDWEKTWTVNGKLWLRDFLPAEFPEARIMSYGYNSDVCFTKARTGLEDEAAILLDRLKGVRTGPGQVHRPLIFIAHSLGGILVKKCLNFAHANSDVYSDLLGSIRSCIFFGVPHRGSNSAFWASFGTQIFRSLVGGKYGSIKYVQALQKNSDQFFGIHQEFVPLTQGLKLRTFYETEKFNLVLIVDRDSAVLGLPNEIAVGIPQANHSTICKFKDKESQSFTLVLRALQELVHHPGKNNFEETTEEGFKCLQAIYDNVAEYESMQGSFERVQGTCGWLLANKKYRAWFDRRSSSILCFSANPGCGKSTIASFLLDHFQEHKDADSIVCYFFFHRDGQYQRDATSAMACVLHQILRKSPGLVAHAEKEQNDKGARFMHELGALWNIFANILKDPRCKDILCIFDGLDECEASSREELFGKMRALFGSTTAKTEMKARVQFFVTSRPSADFESDFEALEAVFLKGESENEVQEAMQMDLKKVIESRVDAVCAKRRLDDEDRAFIMSELVSRAENTFLWVSLVFDVLDRSPRASRAALNTILNTTPEDLTTTFDRLRALIPENLVSDAIRVIQILLAAERLLTLEEMNVAFSIRAIPRQKVSLVVLDDYLEPSIRSTIRDICGSLVNTSGSKFQLVHLTARDYLTNCTPSPWKEAMTLELANLEMAQACIYFLLCPEFEDEDEYLFQEADDSEKASPLEASTSYLTGHHFLSYAALHWIKHFEKSQISADHPLIESAVELCNPRSRRCLNWYTILEQERDFITLRANDIRETIENYNRAVGTPQLQALHIASYLGLTSIISALIRESGNPQVKSPYGQTALHFAVSEGHTDTVKVLLTVWNELDLVDDIDASTALHYAAKAGHADITEMLLARGASVNATDANGSTALHWAAREGYSEVTNILLEHGADCSIEDKSGAAPLVYVLIGDECWPYLDESYDNIVQALLSKDLPRPSEYVRAKIVENAERAFRFLGVQEWVGENTGGGLEGQLLT